MSSYDEFIKAICDGNLEQIKLLFHDGYLQMPDAFGEYAIHHACKNNRVAILKFLIEKKCDFESSNQDGMRPIHLACEKGYTEIIKSLIRNNCELQCKTKDNKSPLEMTKNKECIQILEEAKANKPIASAMNLKCEADCNHKCCLSSVLSGTYDKGILIGHGKFAEVFKLELQSGKELAVKEIYISQLDAEISGSVECNINSYRDTLIHERIVKYIGAIKLQRKIDIYMEFMAGGSLEDLMKLNGALPHQDIARYIRQILEGVAFLHVNKIIHRDIKPANILLDHNKDVKIGDFGYSILIESIISSRKRKDGNSCCGTLNYMAPEVIRNESSGFSSDIWSVGATTIHMLTGRAPFDKLQSNKLIIEIGTKNAIDFIPLLPISEKMENFVKRMLICPKEDRPVAYALLSEFKLLFSPSPVNLRIPSTPEIIATSAD